MLNNVAQVYWKRSQVRYEAGDARGAEQDRLAACPVQEGGIVDASSGIIIDADFCTPGRAYQPFPSRDAVAAFQSFKLGVRAFGKMRKDMAINHLSRAIELNPRLVDAYKMRALAHRDIDPSDCDRAIADFSSAIEIDPKDAQALYERGLTYFKRGKEPGLEK